MYKILFGFCMLIMVGFLNGQAVVINELDCDTPGIDDKEFVELKSSVPLFSLDGYVLVFFNGSVNGGNLSYLTLDLSGYITDINGLLLIGSNAVIPFPQYRIPENVIQNGADAVAIYKNNADAFPLGTLAYVDATLIDVLVYGTTDPDATATLDIFRSFRSDILQINEGSGNNTNSIQRNNDGSYNATVPTPRKLNDGSGIVLNGVLTVSDKEKYIEGNTITATFTMEQAVTSDLDITFTLDNGSFDANDYQSTGHVVIAAGNQSASIQIVLKDDDIDEGDEELLMTIAPLPNTFLLVNNGFVIRIEDNDYKVADFGTPLRPTYGKVMTTMPIGYYDSIDGKSGGALRQALQDIIADANVVRAQTYNDVIDMLKETDQNPENSNQVWLVYTEEARSKIDFQISSDNFNTWNREHTWPRSRGGFDNSQGDDIIDGKDIFWPSNADSTRHANSDVHAIRAEDSQENSSRGNQFYGQYVGPANNQGSFKGDVARGIFYLDVRYNGLELVNGYPETEVGKFGDLATLLEWHRNDPPDDFEMNRNNIIYAWQGNRNPFIDTPDLVEYIWGSKMNETWLGQSAVDDKGLIDYKIFPNPTSNTVFITGIHGSTTLHIFNNVGQQIMVINANKDTSIEMPAIKGIYTCIIKTNTNTVIKKIVVD